MRKVRTVYTYKGAHQKVRRLWGAASQYPCVKCNGPSYDWAYDGMDPSSHTNFSGHPEFYMPMCRKCHRQYDLKWYINAPRPEIKKVQAKVDLGPRTEKEWDQYLKSRKASR